MPGSPAPCVGPDAAAPIFSLLAMSSASPATGAFARTLAKFRFRPQLVDSLRDYDPKRFARDAVAGTTVAIVALPLAMAFAIASGVKPEVGLFTAIVAGFLISALGGSRVQIGGPAGAFIVIIYGIIEKYGLANLLISTMMAGVLLFAMGFFRLGNLVKFIPVSIVIGFTNGIAVLIALSQVKDFFGLAIAKMPGDFFHQLTTLWGARASVNWYAVAIAALSLAVLFLWPKEFKSKAPTGPRRVIAMLPAPLLVLVAATVVVAVFGLPVETIGSKFGGIPQTLPGLTLPDFEWALVKQLFAPTVTIALLGAIESLLCARVADSMIDARHDPNQELMGQGVANFVAPLFGGFVATGTIARTVTNIRAGATSPVAGMLHSVVLLIIVLAAAPLAASVPLAVLAAILMFVAWNMGEWNEFQKARQFSNNYRIILISTFLLTVIFDLTVAVEVGIFLACLFFITRISQLTHIEPVAIDAGPAPGRIEAYRVIGSMFFGAVDKLESLADPASEPRAPMPEVLILDLDRMLNLDTTGLDAIEGLHKALHKNGRHLVLCAATEQPMSLFQRSGFAVELGAQNLVADLDSAVRRARELLTEHA